MLDKVNNIDPLNKDKPRVSLEAAIVSAGTGIILLYLIQEAQSKPFFREDQKKIYQDGIKPAEAGSYGSRQGKISIKPLDEVEYRPIIQPERNIASLIFDSDSELKNNNNQEQEQNEEATINTRNDQLTPRNANPINGNNRAPISRSTNFDDDLKDFSNESEPINNIINPATPLVRETTRPGTGQADFSIDSNVQETGDIINNDTEEDKAKEDKTKPELGNAGNSSFIVVVKTKNDISSQSINGDATVDEILRQIGVEESTISFDSQADLALEILSDQQGRFTARSLDEEAKVNIVNRNIGSLETNVTGTKDIIVDVEDWLKINLDANQTTLMLDNRVSGIEETSIQTNNNGMLGAIQASSGLEIWTRPNSNIQKAQINILANALKDSLLTTSDENDILSITSNIEGSLNKYELQRNDNDVSFDLEKEEQEIIIDLSSQGINNSIINTGAGDDHLTITATINPDLIAELEDIANEFQNQQGTELSSANKQNLDNNQIKSLSNNAIDFERIGAIDSTILMGEGNDYLSISGKIINTEIDMGSGINHLLIEDQIDENSRINLGDDGSKLEYRNDMNSTLKGSEGNEIFIINSKYNTGFVDASNGNDTLISQSNLRKELKLDEENKGTLEGVQFENIENINLGPGDDVAIIDFKATLTGQLLGGDGLDRLDFSNWEDPINVDLNLGISTGIFGSEPMGISEFEQVTGGEGSDFIASTGSADKVEGGGGHDVLFHNWSPWLSNEKEGTELFGNDGEDIYVMSGLGQSTPNDWDGIHGLPTFKDLDLSKQPSSPGTTTKYNDRIGMIATTTEENGINSSILQLLTPSDLDGIGDATKLPIGTIDKLFLGAENSNVKQIAIGLSTSDQQQDMMYYIGDDDKSPVAIAFLASTGLPQEKDMIL